METVPDPQAAFTAFLQQLQQSLVPATRAAAALPSGRDLAFHATLDRSLGRSVDLQAARVLDVADRVLEWASSSADSSAGSSVPASSRRSGATAAHLRPYPLRNPHQVCADEFSASLGNAVDYLLGQADTLLAEHQQISRPRVPASRAAPLPTFLPAQHSMRDKRLPLPVHIMRANIHPLPQRAYVETKPDNRLGIPWSRSLRFGKPHVLDKPQGWVAPLPVDADGDALPEGRHMGTYSEEDDPRKNPYYYEILASTPPDHAYIVPRSPEAVTPSRQDTHHTKTNESDSESYAERAEPESTAPDHQLPLPHPHLTVPTPLNFNNARGMAGVPFTWIDNKVGVEALLSHLTESRVTEIAVDLEHHNLRSYQGLTCLMQISTRWHDFIVDTLTEDVRVHAEKLNQIFTDPNKVKILHGADADVLWLQRDLGLYLVNMFDTFHAATKLAFPKRGLAYLLELYVNFEADKRFQMADWRIRPLPLEMLFYARSDTHSLLYVYDRLRAELLQEGGKAAITDVFTRSKSVEHKVYVKPEWKEDGTGPDSWTGFYRRFSRQLTQLPSSSQQSHNDIQAQAQDAWLMLRRMFLLRELHRLRDTIAREEDDSARYILGGNTLLQLVQVAPTTTTGVTGALGGRLTDITRRYRDKIASLIKDVLQQWDAAVMEASAPKDDQQPSMTQAIMAVQSKLRLPGTLVANILETVPRNAVMSPPEPVNGVPIHPLARMLSAAQQADDAAHAKDSIREAPPKLEDPFCSNAELPHAEARSGTTQPHSAAQRGQNQSSSSPAQISTVSTSADQAEPEEHSTENASVVHAQSRPSASARPDAKPSDAAQTEKVKRKLAALEDKRSSSPTLATPSSSEKISPTRPQRKKRQKR